MADMTIPLLVLTSLSTNLSLIQLSLIQSHVLVIGMVMADMTIPGCSLIYINEGFKAVTGYGKEKIGCNAKFLQGKETEVYLNEEIMVTYPALPTSSLHYFLSSHISLSLIPPCLLTISSPLLSNSPLSLSQRGDHGNPYLISSLFPLLSLYLTGLYMHLTFRPPIHPPTPPSTYPSSIHTLTSPLHPPFSLFQDSLQQSSPLVTKLHNYKANGQKFQNLLALHPVFGPLPDTEYKWQIGMQIDFNNQDPDLPRKIMEMGRVLRNLPQVTNERVFE